MTIIPQLSISGKLYATYASDIDLMADTNTKASSTRRQTALYGLDTSTVESQVIVVGNGKAEICKNGVRVEEVNTLSYSGVTFSKMAAPWDK